MEHRADQPLCDGFGVLPGHQACPGCPSCGLPRRPAVQVTRLTGDQLNQALTDCLEKIKGCTHPDDCCTHRDAWNDYQQLLYLAGGGQ